MVFGKRALPQPSLDRIRFATGSGARCAESTYAAQRTMEDAFSTFHNRITAGQEPTNFEIDRIAHAIDAADLREFSDGPCGNITSRLADLLRGAVDRRRAALGPATCEAVLRHSDKILARAERKVRLRLAHPASTSTMSVVAASLGLQRVARTR